MELHFRISDHPLAPLLNSTSRPPREYEGQSDRSIAGQRSVTRGQQLQRGVELIQYGRCAVTARERKTEDAGGRELRAVPFRDQFHELCRVDLRARVELDLQGAAPPVDSLDARVLR